MVMGDTVLLEDEVNLAMFVGPGKSGPGELPLCTTISFCSPPTVLHAP